MVTAKTGQIGPDIPTAKTTENPQIGANTGGFNGAMVSAQTTLRAAKKKPKLEAEVTFGPTEVKPTEQAQEPRNSNYLERLRKRAK